MCSVTIRVGFKSLGRERSPGCKQKKPGWARCSLAARAVTSWVTNWSISGSLCSFLQALHSPFLFFLDLTSSVEKEFFFMMQTRGGWNPTLAKWWCYLGKDSCTPSQQRRKLFCMSACSGLRWRNQKQASGIIKGENKSPNPTPR